MDPPRRASSWAPPPDPPGAPWRHGGSDLPEVLADNPGVIWVQGLCPSTRRLARHHSRAPWTCLWVSPCGSTGSQGAHPAPLLLGGVNPCMPGPAAVGCTWRPTASSMPRGGWPWTASDGPTPGHSGGGGGCQGVEAPRSLACLVGPMPAPSGLQTPVLLGDVVKTHGPNTRSKPCLI